METRRQEESGLLMKDDIFLYLKFNVKRFTKINYIYWEATEETIGDVEGLQPSVGHHTGIGQYRGQGVHHASKEESQPGTQHWDQDQASNEKTDSLSQTSIGKYHSNISIRQILACL